MSDLKLEQGKFYRTRDGRKAFVAAVIKPSPFSNSANGYPVVVYLDHELFRRFYNLDGSLDSDGSPSCLDLVAEWREPQQIAVELVMVRRENGTVNYSTSRGGRVTHMEPDTIIARKQVTITEGEGV